MSQSNEILQTEQKDQKNEWVPIKRFLLAIPLSWIIGHIWAFLGPFVSLFYPILWVISPSLTICVVCRTSTDGENCYLCKHRVDKKIGFYPRNLRSVLYNTLVLMLISVIAFFAVFVEGLFIDSLGLLPPEPTAIFRINGAREYAKGEVVPISIDIVGMEGPVNALQADILYDINYLEFISISKEDTFATIFIEEEVDTELGFIRISGGIENPGVFGDSEHFVTIYFNAIKEGTTSINYLSSSLVLSNDGKGTNILKDTEDKLILISDIPLPQKELKLNEQLRMDAEVKGTRDVTQLLDDKVDSREVAEIKQKIVDGELDISKENEASIESDSQVDNKSGFITGIRDFDSAVIRFWKEIIF